MRARPAPRRRAARYVPAPRRRAPHLRIRARELARRYLAAHAAGGRRRPGRLVRPAAPRRAGGPGRRGRRGGRGAAPARIPAAPAAGVRPLPARLARALVRGRAAKHAARVHPGGGILRATATADGRAVGLWTLKGGRGRAAAVRAAGRARPHGARARGGGRRALPRALSGMRCDLAARRATYASGTVACGATPRRLRAPCRRCTRCSTPWRALRTPPCARPGGRRA